MEQLYPERAERIVIMGAPGLAIFTSPGPRTLTRSFDDLIS